MRPRKFNKYERKIVRAAAIKAALSGSGRYLYQNSSRAADLTLPRPTASGLRVIPAGGQFQGDDYYMQLVKTGMLRLVEILEPNDTQTQGESMNEKLILDQPETITKDGTVEHIVKKDVVIVESKPQQKTAVLLNESPDDDGFIIVG